MTRSNILLGFFTTHQEQVKNSEEPTLYINSSLLTAFWQGQDKIREFATPSALDSKEKSIPMGINTFS